MSPRMINQLSEEEVEQIPKKDFGEDAKTMEVIYIKKYDPFKNSPPIHKQYNGHFSLSKLVEGFFKHC